MALTVRSAMRNLRKKGYLGPAIEIKDPHKYLNRWQSQLNSPSP